MIINNSENEALAIFRNNPEQFPMIHKCLEAQSELLNAANQMDGKEPDMDVIWVGKVDDMNNGIICKMIADEGYIAKAYLARVIYKGSNEIEKADFVSFSTNMAFARLVVPRSKFADCSVEMEMAMIDPSARSFSKTIPLNTYSVEKIDVDYEITAPAITRQNADNKIHISYYAFSSESYYDYVYKEGRAKDQMYFPSVGKITIKDIKDKELSDVDMKLIVSDGIRHMEHPEKPNIKLTDNTIEYSFNYTWTGKRLSDCFNTAKYTNANAYYLLDIEVLLEKEKGGDIIKILITNIEAISGKTIEEKLYNSIKKIEEIEVYLDCFAEGTLITMADGSKKTVESIQSGDLIKTKDNMKSTVKDVQIQEDMQVLTICLESGMELSLTDGHAVYTKDGVFPVSRLKEGQELIMEEGIDRIKEIIPHCERRYSVYSLFLEGGDEWLFANGAMVHSSDSGDLFKDRDWVREDLPEEWRKDYDNALRAGIVYGQS